MISTDPITLLASSDATRRWPSLVAQGLATRDLRGAYIIGCIFDRAQLRGADFRRARVEGCHWRRCHTLRHAFGLPPMRALMRPR